MFQFTDFRANFLNFKLIDRLQDESDVWYRHKIFAFRLNVSQVHIDLSYDILILLMDFSKFFSLPC